MLEEGWTLIQSTGEPVSQSVKMQTRGEKATGDGNRDQRWGDREKEKEVNERDLEI